MVFVNEGIDGTLDFLRKEKITHIHSDRNVGICIAMNRLATLANTAVFCYMNDDMYPLPEWDKPIISAIINTPEEVLFSSTMIEPHETGNPCVMVQNFGEDLASFKLSQLLDARENIFKENWSGSSWPPLFLKKTLWDKIGGFDETYSPGMYSDPDLAMKAWQSGVRVFKGFGNSFVYHFGSKTTRRLGKNKGRSLFIKKWGMSAHYFYKKYLRMGTPYRGPLSDFKPPLYDKCINKIKQFTA